ncbi:hypothetical protein MNBD_PLANCTO02-1535 [hydrothermal vent metagenome]|uniref:Flagellar protein FlgJ N-terminal domain-containing protein n=1 Tax=hydrothermal vent metagenome TaxID=652676 RepID=A0A3B1DJM9_9ZZZZ
MTSISSLSSTQLNSLQQVGQSERLPQKEELTAQDAFQGFVAGTFYKMMLKSLRSAEQKPAYFHGGRAEDIFRGQLDQTISEDLAKEHGSAFSDPLFQVFTQQIRSAQAEGTIEKVSSNLTEAASRLK